MFTRQCRAHFASLEASDELCQLVRREAVSKAVSLRLTDYMWWTSLNLASVQAHQRSRDGLHLLNFVATMLRVAS